jgi:glycosyltransferase involved in cell wall biosynthesis
MRTLQLQAEALVREERPDFLHCRSYPPAAVGLRLKRKTGCPLIFDMRGFWPDERREGGRWSDRSLFGRTLYRRWKGIERSLISRSDHIVTLTQAARFEIETWACYRGAPISIIPCCADFELFEVADAEQRVETKALLGFDADDPVLGYLGSVGTVYRLPVHVRLYEAVRRRDPRAKMLFIGSVSRAEIELAAREASIELSENDFRIVQAGREDVPKWLGTFDVGTNFRTATPSSKGVSATKVGEYLACGVPCISNAHIGDTDKILAGTGGGIVIEDFSDPQMETAADAFFALRRLDPLSIRKEAQALLDLPIGVAAYRRIYDDLSTPVLVSP